MKKIAVLFLSLLSLFIFACAPVYTLDHSKPVKPISLPADDAAHNWAQQEWWYYTGHLAAQDGREFGYEVTFFKRITNEDDVPYTPVPAYWLKDVAMLGHFAVTDLQNGKFKAVDKNNFLFTKSKADANKYDVMIGSWSVREKNGKQVLRADMKGYKIELELEPLKPAAFHGQNGIVDKGANHCNYYYSYTNLKTSGTLTVDGQPIKVEGTSWMDHEYGTMRLSDPQSGWDWFSVQLDNNSELMIYLIRNDRDKVIDAGGGTFVLPTGKTIWFTKDDIDVKALDYWYSKKTDANYPALWDITVKSLNLKLHVAPMFAAQELNLKPLPYWEGSVRAEGTYGDLAVKGKGYVELVGYSKKYNLLYMQ